MLLLRTGRLASRGRPCDLLSSLAWQPVVPRMLETTASAGISLLRLGSGLSASALALYTLAL